MNTYNINELFEIVSNEAISKRIFTEIHGRKITYKELLVDVNKILIFFSQKGLKKGDRVILSTKEDYYTTLFFLSCLRFGIVTVFVDPEVPQKKATAIINKAEANGIIMDQELFSARNITKDTMPFQIKINKYEQKKGGLFKKLLGNKAAEIDKDTTEFPALLVHIGNEHLTVNKVEPEDLAYIIFTSGTTSSPKGVMISHHNLFSHLQTLSKVYGLDENARILNILMLYHADGCIQGPLLTLYNQATWVRPFNFEISKINDLFLSIYKNRITHFIAVPTILSFMDKFSDGYEDSFQTNDFRFIISCASKLEKKLWVNFEKKFSTKLVNVYGLTETVAGALFSGLEHQLGSEGTPVDCEAKILNENGNNADFEEVGDLYLKGEHIFQGYFNDPEATSSVLNNGWLNTGDIAFRDSQGYYHIIGRSKNTINSGGINIYPEQVTEMVNTCPAILESICLGVADETFGEKMVCAYVLRPQHSIEKFELVNFLRPLLEKNQIPKEFYPFDSLPKGLSGKAQLDKIREFILSQDLKLNAENTYEKTIKELAAESFGLSVENIPSSANSQNLDGWDSMGHLVLITSLEKHFNVTFTTAEILTMTSFTSINDILKKKMETSLI